MREFIRHPLDVPISYSLAESVFDDADYLKDISAGGLCFCSKHDMPIESTVHIKIPIKEPEFEADGLVVWSVHCTDYYEIGVSFRDEDTEFNVRMMEQVCHIEHYRKEVLAKEGRTISDEEAAVEWIKKFAKDFPR